MDKEYKNISIRTTTDDELMAIAAQIADERGINKLPSRDEVVSLLIKEHKEKQ